MAKAKTTIEVQGEYIPKARVKNLTPVSRDYPLKDGKTLYLRPAGRGNKGVLVPAAEISAAMEAAERAGAISITEEGDGN